MRPILVAPAFAITALGSAIANKPFANAIWQPEVGTNYQMILTGVVDPTVMTLQPDVPIYDIDLFYHPKSTIDWLHDQGKKVICYFDAGSAEDWRPDYYNFTAADKGPCYVGWAGERWLNTKSPSVWKVMANRIALAAEKGCDGVDPDNVENYDDGNYFGITRDDGIAYVKKIADLVHSYGMSMGLKNADDILHDVIDDIEFAVNESCASAYECDYYEELIDAGKPVFHVEYVSSHNVPAQTRNRYCLKGDSDYSSTFSTTIKVLSLNGWVLYCDGTSETTVTTSDGVKKGLKDCPNGN